MADEQGGAPAARWGARIIARFRREWQVARATVALRRHGVRHGRRPFAEGTLPWVGHAGAELRIGSRPWIRGIEGRAVLRTDPGARLLIGDDALLNSGSSIHASIEIVIGDALRLGCFSSIQDSDAHEVVPGEGIRRAPVRIGDDVWIGRGATILPGVAIGDGAVIGAGAVVTRSVPAHSVAVGVPARVVRTFETSVGRRI